MLVPQGRIIAMKGWTVDTFRVWKRYASAVEGALHRAGFPDASFAVLRATPGETTQARWAWPTGSPRLRSTSWPGGLELVWSSQTGWAYQDGKQDRDQLVSLPVPALAAPQALVDLLPVLMDGRTRQLPTSEDRWEHAKDAVAWARSAAVYGDDKYDDAYQAAEEEAEAFLRWQDELDGKDTGDLPPAETPPDQGETVSPPREGQRRGKGVLLDPDGVALPPAEEASLGLVVRMLAVCAELAGEMSREPHSPTVHMDVLLAQYGRVANVAQWVGLAATALRRDLLEHLGRAPVAGKTPRASTSEPARYRIVAQRTDDTHPGAATLTNYTYARSVEEAVSTIREENEKPDGLYGNCGVYRVVEVTEEEPDASEARYEEVARRRFLTTIMNAALADTHGGLHPNPELFGLLTDFFTRAIIFPGELAQDDGQLHTSDPSRALAHLLLEHLHRHGLDLEDAPEVDGYDTSAPGDAEPELVDVIAQALQDSHWFASAEAEKGLTVNDKVTFTTRYGARYVLHVTLPSDSTGRKA